MWRKAGIALAGLILAVVLVQVVWYRIDGLPRPETALYLSGDGYRVAREEDGGYLLTPDSPNGYGLMIMHGALIMPQSYLKTAAWFAGRGYTVYLPRGFLRLSILAVDRAASRLDTLGLRGWFFIGHSMGGMATLTLLDRHAPDARAVALWAASQPVDFSDLDVPVLFLWGDRDGLLPAEAFERGKDHLPASTRYVTLSGANHRDFAMYTHQFFDNEGTLGWETQIELANEATADFFAEFSD